MNYTNNSLYLTDYEYQLYARHLVLPNIQISGQKRLKKAKVLFVGAGGLASPTLLYLTAAGIGQIGIIDNDYIELSNLQRQIIYNVHMIGKSKASSAKKQLNALNPLCKIKIYETRLTQSNQFEIIHPYDIVIDSTDNFDTRYIISDTCEILNKVHIYGAVSEFEGQVSIFNYQGGTSYRDIYPLLNYNTERTCSRGGILGIVTGVIGLIQATEAIKIITGIGNIMNQYLLFYNSLNLSFKKKFTCRRNRYVIHNTKINLPSFNFKNILISLENLKNILKNYMHLIYLIDIRNEIEYKKKHLYKAINIPLNKLKKFDNLHILEHSTINKNIVIYCNTSIQSQTASAILTRANIQHLLLYDIAL
uniref:Probable molybdopterin-synthase adenylyltransferase n=1 Tax=Kumanoa americana TaxID=1196377 RepID=A0A1C9CGR9_9FLOR|nr:molybdopterin biosynthesis protein [Kumanoa americana]AOM67588.1 molybdopterin biosynthesis protein [Kumanoa americana]